MHPPQFIPSFPIIIIIAAVVIITIHHRHRCPHPPFYQPRPSPPLRQTITINHALDPSCIQLKHHADKDFSHI